jgi:hypothetical protein
MTKEVKKCECLYCESVYKLLYDLSSTSGYPKFCPFCSEPMYEDKHSFDDGEEDE